MATLLGLALTVITVYHVRTDEIVVHALTFVVSVIVIGVRTMQLINTTTLTDSIARKQVWRMVIFGAGNYYPPT